MSAVPRARSTHAPLRAPNPGAILAAAAYAIAAFAVYQLVAPVLGGDAPQAGAAGAAAPPATTGLEGLGPEDLALRAVAGRAKTSAYVVEGAGGAQGTGFLAWVRPRDGTSFVLTARSVVAGMLAEGTRAVYVKRGNRFWPARILRADPNTGLAVLRLQTVLERPLWPLPGERAKPAVGAPVAVVPAGSDVPFGEGVLTAQEGRFFLRTSGERAYLGAPVVADGGRLAGVVVELRENGDAQVAPLGAACRRVRFC
ncbi:MAG: trypsin-like peptidase domain-containing protein [Thermoleophilia bacterium]|nr:trypsin-like peptidase domain-containing protein [Thermoleophilia bacterium]